MLELSTYVVGSFGLIELILRIVELEVEVRENYVPHFTNPYFF